MKEYDPDEEITSSQMEYASGRTERQKTWLLKCKEVRKHIIARPGITAKQLREEFKANGRMVDWLLAHKFIHYTSEFGFEATPI